MVGYVEDVSKSQYQSICESGRNNATNRISHFSRRMHHIAVTCTATLTDMYESADADTYVLTNWRYQELSLEAERFVQNTLNTRWYYRDGVVRLVGPTGRESTLIEFNGTLEECLLDYRFSPVIISFVLSPLKKIVFTTPVGTQELLRIESEQSTTLDG